MKRSAFDVLAGLDVKAPSAPPIVATNPFDYLLELDARLVGGGFPAMSPWWRSTLAAFYASGKRWGVFEVGRGGGKSTTLTRVAVAEGLAGDRAVPPGQRWIWPFVSASTTDARRRIVEIAAILHAIGIEVEPSYPQGVPTIEVSDARGNPIAFVALASTIANMSGPSTIGATVDEEAKLRNARTLANPAAEIIASLLQTFRARPGIRAIRCSSAWTKDGTHAAAVAEGDTDSTFVARIGAEFLPAAVAGLVDVAAWEAGRGNATAAARLRAYASSLTASSAHVATWTANPSISALASRREVEAMPASALQGVSRVDAWLRENCGELGGAAGANTASPFWTGGTPLGAVNVGADAPPVERQPISPFIIRRGWGG